MNLTNDAVVRARLATWQRRIHETASSLVPPQMGSPQTALLPVLGQLVTVNNLAFGLIADLRQSTDCSLATSRAGRDYLAQLATALTHVHRAAAHLTNGGRRPRRHPPAHTPSGRRRPRRASTELHQRVVRTTLPHRAVRGHPLPAKAHRPSHLPP